ncbi:MAG: Arm DNA-binding domain-containing protein, partial [Paracoccaceae bacterium]|nr:Arm DNA-binding domain-containing protein [Paracoccaceae bacterium]
MKLTETDISKATYLAAEPRRSDGNNLYFLMSENGAKSFQRKHEIPFEPGVWIAMGRYPEDLTLKEARDLNQALKKLLAAQYSVENIVSALTR